MTTHEASANAPRALDYALELWRRGLAVIPVPRPRAGVQPGQPGDGKVPAIAWRAYQQRRPTEAELRAWFATEQNIAVITGAVPGVVVIDADSPDSLRWCVRHLPYTPWQTQTKRGFHLWYRHPGRLVRNRAKLETRDGRLAIDVRGDGGYVIAPGSRHASGAAYAWAGEWDVPRDRLPYFWIGWLVRAERPRASGPAPLRPRSTGPLIERAARYLAAIPRPEIGQASDAATFYAAARLLRGYGLSPADAEALLWEWAGGRPGWTRAWIAEKVAHAARYATEPIGGLA